MREIIKFRVEISKEEATHRPQWEREVLQILEPLGFIAIERWPNPCVLTFQFDHYPAQLDEVWQHLQARGFYGSVWERREYTPTELLDAAFLRLGTEAVVSSVDGTLRWDWVTICPHCGFAEERWDWQHLQISDLPTGSHLAAVDWHPLVVSAPLAEALQQADVTGLSLIPVGPERPAGWYALQPTHLLPPLLVPPTRMRRLPTATPHCARDHHWESPTSELYYRQDGFAAADVNASYEVFGDGGRATGRIVIISNRVYRLLLAMGVTQLVGCEPIRVVASA